jgi:hypothetical protein
LIGPESSHKYFLDFNESQVVLNIDVVLLAGVLDEGVEARDVSGELLVGVDDGEVRSRPADLSSFGVKIPVSLGDHEVKVLDFSVIGSRRDVEDGGSSIEVEMDARTLVD